jgi:hypothetical protein
MARVVRHRLPNAGKSSATRLAAMTRLGKVGEATWHPSEALAYLARMGVSTYRGAASTYWRRRFIVLVTGLMAFSLAAWGLSDALAVDAGRTSRSTQDRQSAQPTPAPAPAPSPSASSPRLHDAATGQAIRHPEILVTARLSLNTCFGDRGLSYNISRFLILGIA